MGAVSGAALRRFDVACAPGLEETLSDELAELAPVRTELRRGGVSVWGPASLGMAICLWSRTAVRVQEVLVVVEAPAQRDLSDALAEHPWEDVLEPRHTLAVSASVRDAAVSHSGYAALLVKDAVVDRLRARTGRRPDVARDDPDVPLRLVWHGTRAQLGRELSGESLHKRGYRPIGVKSPLNEAVAAGLLRLAGWRGQGVLADPMCGSGTFLVEAALVARCQAPGLLRSFAFERWPDLDRAGWQALREEARARVVERPDALLLGADRHDGALAIASGAVAAAGVQQLVTLTRAEVAAWEPARRPDLVTVNPPWGKRLGDEPDAWRDLGRFLRARCAGATAWVLSGDPTLTRHLGLRASRRVPVRVGPVDARWLRYELREPKG